MSHVAFPAFILASAIHFLVRSKTVKAKSFLFYEFDPLVNRALDKGLVIKNKVEFLAHIAWFLPSFIGSRVAADCRDEAAGKSSAALPGG